MSGMENPIVGKTEEYDGDCDDDDDNNRTETELVSTKEYPSTQECSNIFQNAWTDIRSQAAVHKGHATQDSSILQMFTWSPKV